MLVSEFEINVFGDHHVLASRTVFNGMLNRSITYVLHLGRLVSTCQLQSLDSM